MWATESGKKGANMTSWQRWGVQPKVRVWLNQAESDCVEGILEVADGAGVSLSDAKHGQGGKGGDIGQTFIPYTGIARVDKIGEGRNIAQEQIESLRRQAQSPGQ
jgi:hypothetical protein